MLLRRGKRHDYFTSSLPFAQKGEEISIPLGTSAPVKGIGAFNTTYPSGAQTVYESGETTTTSFAATKNISNAGGNTSIYIEEDPNNAGFPGVFADLTEAADVTINALRVSIAMQQFLELDARGGTRYTEILRAHFGVISPDARLQRPEYLGGGSAPLNITPVTQQSETTTESPQGNLAAFGTVGMRRQGWSKSFVEHGHVIVLVSARADLAYQAGLHKMYQRRSREEFYWPTFANLGEQAVLNSEIQYTGTATDQDVFGYQERWAEYRYGSSLVTGLFRSQAAQSLDSWHWAQEFAGVPTLSPEFIVENPPVDRTIAVPDEPHFIGDFAFDVKCARPMPVFSVPGLLRL